MYDKTWKILSEPRCKQGRSCSKTGLSTKRLSELSLNDNTKLKASELYLIALAIQISPAELLEEMCGDLKLVD